MRHAVGVVAGLAMAAASAWVGCQDAANDAPAEGTDASDSPAAEPPSDVAVDATATDVFPAFDAWGSPCVGAEHYVCNDFDDDAGFHDFTLHPTDGGELVIEAPPSGVTPPSSPFVAAMRVVPGAEALGQVHEGDAVNGLHCAVAMYVVQRGSDTVAPVAVRLGNPSGPPPFYQLELQLRGDGGDFIREYGLFPDAATLPAHEMAVTQFGEGHWVELSLDLAIGPNPVLVASVNGVRLVDRPQNDLTGFDKPTHQMLTIGVVAGAGSAPWHLLFDNAVCERLP